MNHFCYIIYSHRLDKFYVGETENFANRLEMHNKGFSRFTSKASDWTLHILIPCNDKSAATKLERHIKSMKSRKYLEDLVLYPEMVNKLLERFS